MSDRLKDIKKKYGYVNGSSCNPAAFDDLSKIGSITAAHDMGVVIDKIEQITSEIEYLNNENGNLNAENNQLKDEINGWKTENGKLREEIDQLKDDYNE